MAARIERRGRVPGMCIALANLQRTTVIVSRDLPIGIARQPGTHAALHGAFARGQVVDVSGERSLYAAIPLCGSRGTPVGTAPQRLSQVNSRDGPTREERRVPETAGGWSWFQ
jgi:hypothetical protein